MTEGEVALLSRSLVARRLRDGNFKEIIEGAAVPQPMVSLALHRRLVLRTDAVDRLFEYLRVRPDGAEAEAIDETGSADRPERRMATIINLVASLSDGSNIADRRLASLLQAIGDFAAQAPPSEWDVPA